MTESLKASIMSSQDESKGKKKTDGLKVLNKLALDQKRSEHPEFPEHALPKPKYSGKTANDLTKCIIDFLRLNGCQAERVSVTGRYLDNRKTITDVVGRQRQIGSTKWIPSSMQKGSADITATIRGRSVKIEIKIGKNRQSEAQKIYQQQIEQAGGIYFVARSFQQFYEWYLLTFEEGGQNAKG